jgi:hypothetical protein
MMKKAVFAAGAALGYVLGTRAGREQYEQLKNKSYELWKSPRIQDNVSALVGVLKDKAGGTQQADTRPTDAQDTGTPNVGPRNTGTQGEFPPSSYPTGLTS